MFFNTALHICAEEGLELVYILGRNVDLANCVDKNINIILTLVHVRTVSKSSCSVERRLKKQVVFVKPVRKTSNDTFTSDYQPCWRSKTERCDECVLPECTVNNVNV